jgi:hypothetical protein
VISGLTPAQAAAAVKSAVGQWGFDWMTDADLRARAKAELGLRGRPMYHLGRAGALGDVPVDVVIAAVAFFPPEVVRRAWEEGRAVATPSDAARFFASGCGDIARRRFPDDEPTARAVALVERVVDGADATGLPLFAGWRLVPRPNDAPGRLGVLLNVLREHRGSVHVAAVAAMGIPALAAVVAGPYGEANARFFEWPEPYPDPAPWRSRWDAAEDLTATAAGRPYNALHADERQELAELVRDLLG